MGQMRRYIKMADSKREFCFLCGKPLEFVIFADPEHLKIAFCSEECAKDFIDNNGDEYDEISDS